MKKLLYIFFSLAIIGFYSCGDSTQEGNTEEAVEAQGEHDHEAMMEKAKEPDNAMKEAPEGARVFFVNLKEGQMVTSPVKIVFGVEGMTVHPAGELIDGTGHHHLFIEAPPVPSGAVIPADEQHIHFGGGQTEVELEMMPGPKMITLQFADGLHRSYGEKLSATINIDVAPPK